MKFSPREREEGFYHIQKPMQVMQKSILSDHRCLPMGLVVFS